MAQVEIFTTRSDFWKAVQALVRTPQRIALSGGSAVAICDYLPLTPKTEVFLVDERWVSHDDPDSNARQIRTRLTGRNFLDRLDFYKPGFSSAECAAEYALQLKTDHDYLLDVVVLGVGPDGHTASLFPTAEALESEELTTVAHTDTFAVKERLSLTFKALSQAQTVLVLLQGQGKKEIFERIIDPQTDAKAYPARTLLDWSNVHIYWLKT